MPLPPAKSELRGSPPIGAGRVAGKMVAFASASLTKPMSNPLASDVAGSPTYVPENWASCSGMVMPATEMFMLIGLVTNPGPGVLATVGV